MPPAAVTQGLGARKGMNTSAKNKSSNVTKAMYVMGHRLRAGGYLLNVET